MRNTKRPFGQRDNHKKEAEEKPEAKEAGTNGPGRLLQALANPLSEGIKVGQSRGREGGNQIELGQSRPRCEQNEAEGGPEGQKRGAGIFGTKKSQKNSENEEEGEKTRAHFQPEAGGIGVAGNKFTKEVEGNRSEGEESVHGSRIRSWGRSVNLPAPSRGRRACALPEYPRDGGREEFGRRWPRVAKFHVREGVNRRRWSRPD